MHRLVDWLIYPTYLDPESIDSRFVNANRVLLQLEDVLERALTEAGYAPEDGSGCVHLFRTKVSKCLVLLAAASSKSRKLPLSSSSLLIDGTKPHRTKQVTDRKSINFDEAGERLVMGSLAAFKGKDWRVVILLDCTEGVLPSKSSVHTTKEVRQ